MKDKKRRIEFFSLFDQTGMEAHLEEMARKGWKLEKITNLFWHYRRIAPKALHFTISYYPKASVYDPVPSDGELTFQDFCAHAGWQLAAVSGEMQIFCNEKETPVPIETDAVLQVETIRQIAKKNVLLPIAIFLILAIVQLLFLGNTIWSNPAKTLARSSSLAQVISWLLVLLLSAVELWDYFRWYHKAKAAAELDGSFLSTHGHPHLQIVALFIMLLNVLFMALSTGSTRSILFLLLYFVYFALALVIVNSIKNFLKRKRFSTSANRTITTISSFVLAFGLVGSVLFLTFLAIRNNWMERTPYDTYEFRGGTRNIYHDPIPLTIEDMVDVDYDHYSYVQRINESPLVSQLDASQQPMIGAAGVPDLYYTITKVKWSILYDRCLDGLIRDLTEDESVPEEYRNYMVEVDAAPWGAVAVYQQYWRGEPRNRYLVCWEDQFLEIRFDWEPTPEQMAIAAEICSSETPL